MREWAGGTFRPPSQHPPYHLNNCIYHIIPMVWHAILDHTIHLLQCIRCMIYGMVWSQHPPYHRCIPYHTILYITVVSVHTYIPYHTMIYHTQQSVYHTSYICSSASDVWSRVWFGPNWHHTIHHNVILQWIGYTGPCIVLLISRRPLLRCPCMRPPRGLSAYTAEMLWGVWFGSTRL